MSSHHVIRENQEPAVAILHSSYNGKILHQTLGWSPYIITISICAEKLVNQGIKLDAVITNGDSDFGLNQGHTTLIRDRPPGLRGALGFLEENGHKGVHVFSKFKLEMTSVIHEFDLTTNVIDENRRWSYLKSGKVRKWFPKNAKIRVAGQSKVLITPQNGLQFSKGIFKTDSAGLFTVESAKAFWLCEHIY